MKKVTSIFILGFFLIANSGLAVSLHWCGGKLASLELNTISKPLCGCGDKTMKPGCCKTTGFVLKASDDFSKSNLTAQVKQTVTDVTFLQNTVRKLLLIPEAVVSVVSIIPPPLITSAPLFIRNRAFLI